MPAVLVLVLLCRVGAARVVHVDASERLFPVVVLDDVLPNASLSNLREKLRKPGIFFDGEGVTFPGKIALLDKRTVEPLVAALRNSKEVLALYPGGLFDDQMQFTRGFASLMCGMGFPHKDYIFPSNTIPPAAVFYVDVPGGDGREELTGTAFFSKDEEAESLDRFVESARIVGRNNRMILYPQDVFHNAWISDESLLDCGVATAPRRMAVSLFFATQGGVTILKDSEDEDEVAKVQRRYSRKSLPWPAWPLDEL
eukprot:g4819.t1